ncbi:MAG: hypothetical protein P1U56_04850 [Saprospiraceae bacterium]|nr:hypothetical protein [Saprospiraceae bacterium]
MNKPRLIKNYESLTEEVQEQIKLVYPKGFSKHLITFKNREGQIQKGLPFETEDFIYLIRMTEAKANALIEGDDDYDENGRLKKKVKAEYEDKYEDDDFMNELNDNVDNDLGLE